MPWTRFEDLEIYRLAEDLSDRVWTIARAWDQFTRSTIGNQLVRAVDSIGANIEEGTGRGSYADNRRFVRIARGSLNETRHWLRRAYKRKMLSEEDVNILKPIMDELAPRLNAYLKSIGRSETRNSKASKNTDE